MANLICLCVDGSSAKGEISKAVKDAYEWNGLVLERGKYRYSKSARVGMSDYLKKVRGLVKINGGDPGALGLLIVGKSLGGAKMYRFLYKHINYLKQFAGVAVALVDPHEPGAPGDEGKRGKWYDYIYFAGGKYRLKWWDEKWGDPQDQQKPDAKLRFYVIYQRNEWPRGYLMSQVHACDCLTGKKIEAYPQNETEDADHWNIAWCDKTVDLMVDAIGYLKRC